MKGCNRRAIELSGIIGVLWALLLLILMIIDRGILAVQIGDPFLRGIFRVATSFSLISLWLYVWWNITIYYYRRRVATERTSDK